MTSKVWRWVLGLIYIFAVATIWIAASFVVQSVVDAGVSPFLITYICNSLFVVYIPIYEIARYLEDTYGSLLFWRNKKRSPLENLRVLEQTTLLRESDVGLRANASYSSEPVEGGEISQHVRGTGLESVPNESERDMHGQVKDFDNGVDAKGRWTRTRVAKVSMCICPFWFLAQLTFNLSLKYTTVTVSSFKT